MAKSLRSKVKQRYRRAKRHFINGSLHTDSITALHERVKKLQQGLSIQAPRARNAFLYPDDPEAVFPQKQLFTPVDFRSESLPLSGYCVTGCRRNFTDEEKLELDLVVGCQDGLLPSEKKRLMDLQEAQRKEGPDDEAMRAADEDHSVIVIGKVDESVLIQNLQGFSLSSFKESSADPITQQTKLEHLKKHQERISGRTRKSVAIPEVKNRLKPKARLSKKGA